ncbi:MAG TPA: right-handed parallel beta-helix repeat-containing protein [Bryobacteraceae bacterium]|nr:right-handed parallel beta-helix repeat-containing protein [Bryobacteraceae bacterium]
MQNCLAVLCAVISVSSVAARDYYVSPRGDDSGAGTLAKPWRTIDKLNAQTFAPGDRVLFEGGQVFAGTLRIAAGTQKLAITSYGDGRATIRAGNAQAMVVEGATGVSVRNLKLTGAGRKTGNTTSGLLFKASTNVEADHIEVSGFRRSGIELDGVENARITHIHAHENGFAGISSAGAMSRNIYVGYSLAENNPGDPGIRRNHSGNGIVIGRVRSALIEHCEARYNGWDQPWTGNGPVGIWTYDSDRVVIQFNVAHHNRSTGQDGGGFDLDGGVTNAIVQYNYSHSNFGTGYLICQYAGAGTFADNVVRYNISQDDGLKDHDAGIFVWVGGPGMKSTLVHNNTIFNSKGSAVAFGVAKDYTGPMPVFTFYNNIFVSQGPQIKGGAEKGRFVGNLYWSVGERGFHVDSYTDLGAWTAATGQEQWQGRLVGIYADPRLRKDGNGLLTDPDQLETLHEYQLPAGSPAIDAGLDLRALFRIDPGRRDYYGAAIPSGSAFDVGAHEFTDGAARVSQRSADPMARPGPAPPARQRSRRD